MTQIHYLRGLILGGQERYREAAAALERTVALNPRHVLARFKLALAYLRLEESDRAETVLQAVVADEPNNMRAYQNLAVLAYTRGDLARAESLARRAVAIDPSYFDAWNTLGAIYVLAKRPSDAVQTLEDGPGPATRKADRPITTCRWRSRWAATRRRRPPRRPSRARWISATAGEAFGTPFHMQWANAKNVSWQDGWAGVPVVAGLQML